MAFNFAFCGVAAHREEKTDHKVEEDVMKKKRKEKEEREHTLTVESTRSCASAC